MEYETITGIKNVNLLKCETEVVIRDDTKDVKRQRDIRFLSRFQIIFHSNYNDFTYAGLDRQKDKQR